jgi:hypothetical protein
LVADLLAIVSSYCARRSGQRRAKRQSETTVRELTGQEALVANEQEVVEDATR